MQIKMFQVGVRLRIVDPRYLSRLSETSHPGDTNLFLPPFPSATDRFALRSGKRGMSSVPIEK